MKDFFPPPETEPSFPASLLAPLRMLLATMCVGGLLGWSYVILFSLAYYGKAVFSSPFALLLLFPYAYLLLTLYFCFKPPSIKTLAIVGAILNTPLVLIFAYWVWRREDNLHINAFIPIAYVLVWFLLGTTRWLVEKRISGRGQAITFGVAAAILSLGAVIAWPMMINHRSESQKYLYTAVNGEPSDAKANFDASLQHALLIRREYERRSFLEEIAIAQARHRLYDDSANTIKTYLEKDLDQRDRDELMRSIVRAQITNKDYGAALTTARPLNSSGTFSVQSLTLEAVAAGKAGRMQEARQIIATAITLANEQTSADMQNYSFGHIADAQAQLGEHDAALATAHRVNEKNLIVLLGSMGRNEAEAGYKESARDTLQVIYTTVAESASKCGSKKTSLERDQCLLTLVEVLGDDRFFNLATSVARSINSISTRDLAFRKIFKYEAQYLNSDLEDLIKN